MRAWSNMQVAENTYLNIILFKLLRNSQGHNTHFKLLLYFQSVSACCSNMGYIELTSVLCLTFMLLLFVYIRFDRHYIMHILVQLRMAKLRY